MASSDVEIAVVKSQMEAASRHMAEIDALVKELGKRQSAVEQQLSTASAMFRGILWIGGALVAVVSFGSQIWSFLVSAFKT